MARLLSRLLKSRRRRFNRHLALSLELQFLSARRHIMGPITMCHTHLLADLQTETSFRLHTLTKNDEL